MKINCLPLEMEWRGLSGQCQLLPGPAAGGAESCHCCLLTTSAMEISPWKFPAPVKRVGLHHTQNT